MNRNFIIGPRSHAVTATALTISLLLCFTSYLGAGTYYASPDGGGNGSSTSSPFQISDFWEVAQPGDVLLLLEGTYLDKNSMINPLRGLSGTAGNPITIKALQDGKVVIDGRFQRRPVYLLYNDYFVLEGFDAHSSSDAVVELSRSNHNIVRRVCAWDAGDVNTGNCFAVHHGEYTLFEDCAGWGIARKVFSNSQGGNHATFRRCWGQWQYSTHRGPKMTFTFAYNSYDAVLENCIGTWDDDMNSVDQPYGVFSMDRNDGDNNARAKLYGCIAYLKNDQRFKPNDLFFITKMNSVDLQDCIAFVESGKNSSVRTLGLYSHNGNSASNLSARNLTCIGGGAPIIDATWRRENVQHLTDGSDLISTRGHILETEAGANVMYRYENGVLTDEPLWPWPMNKRIIDAMKRSGRKPVDVTKTIFELAGGSQPTSSNPLSVTDIRFANVGQAGELLNVNKGTWYDLYIYFNRSDANWEDIAAADVWLHTPFYTAGDSINRGGLFYPSDNYVLSLSISSPGVWAKETKGAEEWRNISGQVGLYVDDDANEFEINPQEGWSKIRVKVLSEADPGAWQVAAYAKGTDNVLSNMYQESIFVQSASDAPVATLTQNPDSPVSGGVITIQLSTSETVVASPGNLFFIDAERAITEISLTGSVPGRVFTGTLNVDTITSEGLGKFTLPNNSLVIQSGERSNDIVSGKYLLVDHTAPSQPKNLSGQIHQ